MRTRALATRLCGLAAVAALLAVAGAAHARDTRGVAREWAFLSSMITLTEGTES